MRGQSDPKSAEQAEAIQVITYAIDLINHTQKAISNCCIRFNGQN